MPCVQAMPHVIQPLSQEPRERVGVKKVILGLNYLEIYLYFSQYLEFNFEIFIDITVCHSKELINRLNNNI